MWFPRAKTDPAEVKLASFADHVITSSVLLNGRSTPWTLLRNASLTIHIQFTSSETRHTPNEKENPKETK